MADPARSTPTTPRSTRDTFMDRSLRRSRLPLPCLPLPGLLAEIRRESCLFYENHYRLETLAHARTQILTSGSRATESCFSKPGSAGSAGSALIVVGRRGPERQRRSG